MPNPVLLVAHKHPVRRMKCATPMDGASHLLSGLLQTVVQLADRFARIRLMDETLSRQSRGDVKVYIHRGPIPEFQNGHIIEIYKGLAKLLLAQLDYVGIHATPCEH